MSAPNSIQTKTSVPKRQGRADILAAYRQQNTLTPKLRARDLAAKIGVSEAELLNARTGEGVTRLVGDFADLIRGLTALGPVMALTRNEHCVHEKHGIYDKINIGPGHGIVLNHDIDLRLFIGHWRHAFAVTELVASGVRQSLQFFDIDGGAVHKIYIPKGGDDAAWRKIIETYRVENQEAEMKILPLPAPAKDQADDEVDASGFLAHWGDLQDTHDFFGLLREFSVGRRQSMRLAEGRFTRRLAADCLEGLLSRAADEGTSIMCFVGNPGCIQIHTGPIERVAVRGAWVNVLDEGFNLHLNQSAIESIWAVEKPTRDGIVTSVEVYNADGQCFCQFFGERKPGQVELSAWRAIVSGLPAVDDASAARASEQETA